MTLFRRFRGSHIVAQKRWNYSCFANLYLRSCKLPLGSSCVRLMTNTNYNGTATLTVGGHVCQRWDRQYPHQHLYSNPDFFPEMSLHEVENYCRAPDGSDWPWCYTTSPEVRRERCTFHFKICGNSRVDGMSQLNENESHNTYN